MGFIILGSCDIDNLISCEGCYYDKPKEGLLSIELSPAHPGDSIFVTIFKGKLETGTLFMHDTITRHYLDIWVPVDEFYTVQAEYRLDSTIIRAIDGDRVSVSLDEINCDEPCWRANDGKADCRLR